MRIEATSLDTCSVIEGGERISLGLVDEKGQPVEIKISTSDACAIAMTLPKLLGNSLRAKYRDDALRYVFPLDAWQVEATSSGNQMILTFSTGGGFEVSFSTPPEMCRSLGSTLYESIERRALAAAAIPN